MLGDCSFGTRLQLDSASVWSMSSDRQHLSYIFVSQLLYYCEHSGMNLMGLKSNPFDLSSFSALTLLVGLFDP